MQVGQAGDRRAVAVGGVDGGEDGGQVVRGEAGDAEGFELGLGGRGVGAVVGDGRGSGVGQGLEGGRGGDVGGGLAVDDVTEQAEFGGGVDAGHAELGVVGGGRTGGVVGGAVGVGEDGLVGVHDALDFGGAVGGGADDVSVGEGGVDLGNRRLSGPADAGDAGRGVVGGDRGGAAVVLGVGADGGQGGCAGVSQAGDFRCTATATGCCRRHAAYPQAAQGQCRPLQGGHSFCCCHLGSNGLVRRGSKNGLLSCASAHVCTGFC